MSAAGKLKYRLTFRSRATDQNGDPVGVFADRFTVWAGVDYQRGSETAIDNRLNSRQPVIITIRDSSQARTITPAFCAVIRGGLRSGERFNITSVAPDREPGLLNLMGYSGGADG